jgi:hypothetical protein
MASVLNRSLPSLGGPGAARTQYLAPIRCPSPPTPFHYITDPYTTHALTHGTSPPFHLRPISVTAHTRSPHSACPTSFTTPARLTPPRTTRFFSSRPSSTLFRLRSPALGRWTTHTVLVSSSPRCVLQKLHHRLCGFQRCTGLPTCHNIYIYTVCPRRNLPDFGSMFLMLKYTDIIQNTYIRS